MRRCIRRSLRRRVGNKALSESDGSRSFFQKPLNTRDGVRGAHRDVYYWRVSGKRERDPKVSGNC